MNEKEITNAINMLATEYFVAYNKMKELIGNPEEAIKLTDGFFTAMFGGSKTEMGSENKSFIFHWDRRHEK